jgi:hypothetical protein
LSEESSSCIKEVASTLWDVDEADRFVKLAFRYPELLTHDEQILWKLIRENGYVWRGRFNPERQWTWTVAEGSLVHENLRKHWDDFNLAASREDGAAYLPTWQREADNGQVSKAGQEITEDDVPF